MFAIFAGMAAADPGLRPEHPEWFDENGNPSWEAIHGNDGPTLSERASMTPAEREAYHREVSLDDRQLSAWRRFVNESTHFGRWDQHHDDGFEMPDTPGAPSDEAQEDPAILHVPGTKGPR